MSSGTRRLIALVGATVAAVALPLVLPASSGAITRPGITVAVGQDVEVTHGPILGSFPITTAAIPTPSGCGNETPEEDATNPPPFGASCDRIPVHVVAPEGLSDLDEYFLRIEVDWVDDSGEGVNDLDIYFWDNTQIEARKDPENEAPGYTQFGESASADKPEAINVFRPDLGDYNLVVLNWSGVTFEYTVKATLQVAKADPIFELLEDPIAPGRDESASESQPLDFSADAPAGATAPFVPAPSGLGETFILPDDDLDAGFGASGFEEALQAPTDLDRVRGAAETGPADPVSGVTVFAWMAGLPLLLAAVVAWALRRRSRLAIRLA